MAYSYLKRKIQTCQARQDVVSSFTNQNLSNIYEQYQRPVLVYSGPTPNREYGASQTAPGFEWPWIPMGDFYSTGEINYTLDRATIWPLYPKASLDISLRMLGYSGLNSIPERNPLEVKSFWTVYFIVDVLRFENGNTDPTVIATKQIVKDMIFYGGHPDDMRYPAQSAQLFSMNYKDPGFLTGGHLVSVQPDELRVCRVYEPDLPMIQNVFMTIDFDISSLGDFQDEREFPLMVHVRAQADLFLYSLADEYSFSGGSQAFDAPDYFRLYNIGSEIRMRGKL